MKRKQGKTVVRKKHSSECFNAPMKPETRAELEPFVLAQRATCEQLREELKSPLEKALVAQWSAACEKRHFDDTGLDAFFACLEFCNAFITDELHKIGWQKNRTGYQPFDHASNRDLLLHGAAECVIIAKKQMLRYLEA
jgi:hypothetical protein